MLAWRCALLGAGVTVMVRVLVIAAALTLFVSTPTGRATGQTTTEQLQEVALQPIDFGVGYLPVRAQPLDQLTAVGAPSWWAIYQRSAVSAPMLDIGFVMLVEAPPGLGPRVFEAAPTGFLMALAEYNISATPIEAPAIGDQTAANALSGTVRGLALSGDAYAWRVGPRFALVGLIGTGGGLSALDLAQLQAERLSQLSGE